MQHPGNLMLLRYFYDFRPCGLRIVERNRGLDRNDVLTSKYTLKLVHRESGARGVAVDQNPDFLVWFATIRGGYLWPMTSRWISRCRRWTAWKCCGAFGASIPNLRVIMFSTLTERGAAVTLEALTLGADDYVTKASNEGSLDRSMARLREELIPKIKQFFRLPGQSRAAARPEPAQCSRRRRSGAAYASPAEYESAAQSGGDRSLHGRADRAGRNPAAVAGRVPIADSGGAAHAASLHAAARRASSRHLPAARRGSEPGRRRSTRARS